MVKEDLRRKAKNMDSSSSAHSHRTIHDFMNEDKPILILGGYFIVKKPLPLFVCNLFYFACMILLLFFLIVMGIATVILFSEEKQIVEQTCHATFMLTTAFFTMLVRLATKGSLKLAADLLLKGIDRYMDEDLDREHDKIKEKRVEEIGFFIPIIQKIFLFCPIANVFFVPLLKLFITKEGKDPPSLNPYLPLPLYMPFNTRTYLGYGVGFLANGLPLFFAYTSGLCLIVTYLSCALQLIAQIEILNHSLRNIEARAYSKLKKSKLTVQVKDKENLYELKEYQGWLYFCLKENILHHQSILRFKEAVRPFLEAVNAIGVLAFGILMALSIILIFEHPNINLAIMGILVLDVTSYFLLCFVCENITNKSAETIHLLYSTPWPHCDTSFKVLLKIMISKAQKLIILRAAVLGQPASLETFGNMMAVGYKMINVIRQ